MGFSLSAPSSSYLQIPGSAAMPSAIRDSNRMVEEQESRARVGDAVGKQGTFAWPQRGFTFTVDFCNSCWIMVIVACIYRPDSLQVC